MRSSELSVVPLDLIPTPPYETPSSDLPRLYATAKKMEHLCRRLGGLGLAAAQVGLPWRLFVAMAEYPASEEFGIFFDCRYEADGSSTIPSVEGCLSLPGKRYRVDRHEKVQVSGMRVVDGPEGFSCQAFSSSFSGLAAVLMQHEIDHDQGRERMIDLIGTAVTPAWR